MTAYSIYGRLDKLEIARGHDGFLRGAPEPIVLFAIYLSHGSTATLLGRSLHRFRPSAEFPSEVTTPDTQLPSCVVDSNGPFAFVALALALEEDNGRDVQRMYGALERERHLSVWSPDAADVDPLSIAAVGATWRIPVAVELCIDGATAAASCRDDKWIGAVCWGMVPLPNAAPRSFRLPFLSADGRNDWTALISIAQ